jgi:hypothetical protein
VIGPVKEAMKCMNTTHKNVIMHYLELIFLNCAAVIPLILPPTFEYLSSSQFSSKLVVKNRPLDVKLLCYCTFIFLFTKELLEV